MPPKLLDPVDLEAMRRVIHSSIKISRDNTLVHQKGQYLEIVNEAMKEKENVDMATLACNTPVTVPDATIGSSANISTAIDGIPLGTLVTNQSNVILNATTPRVTLGLPKNWDCCGYASAKIKEIGEDDFMNKKFNTDTAKTWTDIGKRMYAKSHVAVFFEENYVVFKLTDKIPKDGLTCPAGTVRKYELPIIVLSNGNGKFEAFCHGLSRFYNEFLRDLFGDNVSVERTIDYPTKNETCVIFKDGSEVRCAVAEDDEVSKLIYEETDNFFGVDICFCKKVFGSTSAIKEILEWCDVSARRAKRRMKRLEEAKKYKKEARERRMKEEKDLLEKEIRYEMRRMYIQQQAAERWNERMMNKYKGRAPLDDMVITNPAVVYTEESAQGETKA